MPPHLLERAESIPSDLELLSTEEEYARDQLKAEKYPLILWKTYRQEHERIEGKWLARDKNDLDPAYFELVVHDAIIDALSKRRPDGVYLPRLIIGNEIVAVLWYVEIDENGHYDYKVLKQQHKEEWMVACGKKAGYPVVVIERINVSFRKEINNTQYKKVKQEKMNVLDWIKKSYQEEKRKQPDGPLVCLMHHDFPENHVHINASIASGRFHKVFGYKSVEEPWMV